MTADIKPRLKDWTENIGLKPEEALALLLMLRDTAGERFDEEIIHLQDLIGSREVEKMLGETHE